MTEPVSAESTTKYLYLACGGQHCQPLQPSLARRTYRAARLDVSSQWSMVETQFDALGRAYRSSNHVVPQLADYSYDELNRIGNVTEAQQNAAGTWQYNVAGQTFGYDRYGNRQITSTLGGVNGYNPSYIASTNRINGLTYDAVGNITQDGTRTMTYDGNNKMVTATMTGGVASYRYDAAGQRTLKTVNSVTTWMIYGMGGELIAEYPAQGAASTPQIE